MHTTILGRVGTRTPDDELPKAKLVEAMQPKAELQIIVISS